MTIIRLIAIGVLMSIQSVAQATIIDYSITVAGPFSGNGPNGIPTSGEPFGLPLPQSMTPLSATMTLDSAKANADLNDVSALLSFQMTTGTRTWTQADVDPLSTFFAVFSGDELQTFGISFRDTTISAIMDISTWSWVVVQTPPGVTSYDNSRFCNGCVSVDIVPASVPEPSTISLLGCVLVTLSVFSFARGNMAIARGISRKS